MLALSAGETGIPRQATSSRGFCDLLHAAGQYFFGYVESLLIGLVVSRLSLVVRLSATKSATAVRTVQTGDKLVSNTWHHRDENAYLFASGKRRLIFIAQGLLSFANAPQLLDVTKGSLLAATKDYHNVVAGTAASSMTHPESAKTAPSPWWSSYCVRWSPPSITPRLIPSARFGSFATTPVFS